MMLLLGGWYGEVLEWKTRVCLCERGVGFVGVVLRVARTERGPSVVSLLVFARDPPVPFNRVVIRILMGVVCGGRRFQGITFCWKRSMRMEATLSTGRVGWMAGQFEESP